MAENKTKKKKKSKKKIHLLPSKGYAVVFLLMAAVAVAFLAMMTVVNAFPTDMVMTIIAVLFALLIVAWILLCRRSRFLRIIGLFVAILTIAVYGMGTYYLANTYAMFSRISSTENTERTGSGADLTEEAFNIYLTGIDQWNKERGYDLERSDVNMIVTVSPKVKKVVLTSIPRDTYVPLHRTGTMDKLTHTGIYGVDETLNTVEDWLGIKLDYYVKTNFSGVRDVIDAMGGVDVYSPVAFESSISNYTYEKGWNHCNGKKALFFARERKAFEGKDSIRVENQQRVVEAMLNKLTTSPALLTKYGDIMNAAGSSLETNLSTDDLQSLVRMQLEDLGAWDIQTQKIEGDYDMDYVASLTQEQKFQIYRPKEKSVQKCLDKIEEVSNPTEEELAVIEENKKRTSLIKFVNGILHRDGEEAATEEAAAEGE